MSIAQRTVETAWEGSLASGNGTLNGTSGALDGQPVTWASRTEEPGGKTSPEELAAAAHSACFSMSVAGALSAHKLVATRLVVGATVTLDSVDGALTIVSSDLTVDGDVPGTDAAGFAAIVEEAAAGCPISKLFAATNITITTKFKGQ